MSGRQDALSKTVESTMSVNTIVTVPSGLSISERFG